MTEEMWAEFKAKRDEQRRRDDRILFVIKDFFQALGIIGVGVLMWFLLAVCYA